MGIVLSAIALLLLLSAGSGVFLSLTRRGRKVDFLEFLALSFLFGCAAISGLSFLLGLMTGGLTLRLLTSLISLALLAVGIVRARNTGISITGTIPGSFHDWILVTMIVSQTALLMWFSAHTGLGWDGVFHWEIKARLAFENQGVLPLSYLTDRALWLSHRGYPLLLPLTEAWFYGWIGSAHQGLIKLLFPLFFAAALGLLATASGRRTLIAPLLLSFVPLVQLGDGSVPTGYADFPLAVFYLAGVIAILRYRESQCDNGLAILAAILAAMPWVKQEGNVLFFILGLLFAFLALRYATAWKDRATEVFRVFAAGLLVMVGWGLFVRAFKAPVEHYYLSPTPQVLLANLGRTATISSWLGGELVNWLHWGILWPAVVVAAIIGFLAKRRGIGVISAAVLLPILTYTAIYFIVATDRIPLDEWLLTSLSRLMLHSVPAAILLITFSWKEENPGIGEPKTVDYRPLAAT